MDLYKVAVCAGPNCSANFSADIKNAVSVLVGERGWSADIIVGDGGCYGRCTRGPNVLIIGPIPREEEDQYRQFKVVPPPSIPKQMYNRVSPADVEELIESHCIKGTVLQRLVDRQQ